MSNLKTSLPIPERYSFAAAARSTGDFVFGMTGAYLGVNGEITAPLGNQSGGNGPDVLQNIEVDGNDFAMEALAPAEKMAGRAGR